MFQFHSDARERNAEKERTPHDGRFNSILMQGKDPEHIERIALYNDLFQFHSDARESLNTAPL